ncbi:MAG: helix-turn-helix domain-containing protein [Thermoleophilia bacterium]
MKQSKRKNLESKGWKIGSTQEFLGLTDEEMSYIELKFSLSQTLKDRRQKKNITQMELAKLLKSSQSRVAKMEAGDASVSIDLLVRALFLLGASKRDIAKGFVRSDRGQDTKTKLAS